MLKQDLYESCIRELSLPEGQARNYEVIFNYLSTLTDFINLFKNQSENYLQIVEKISHILHIRKIKKKEIIIREGEKGSEFYVILKGKVVILVLKQKELFMR